MCIKMNLLQHLITTPYKNVKVKKNTFPILSSDSHKLEDINFCTKILKKNKELFQKLIGEVAVVMQNGGEAVFIIDKVKYVFLQRPKTVEILIYKYDTTDFSKIDDKYNQLITNDKKIFKKNYMELVSQFSRKKFYEHKKSSYFEYAFLIAGSSVNPFISEEFLALCNQFHDALSKSNIDEINNYNLNSYLEPYSKEYNKELFSMFGNWYKFLEKKKSTIKKEFSFNDSDNFAYIDSNENYELMMQRSQGTVYAYVREKATGRIKVWNSTYILKSKDSNDFDYFISNKDTYLSAIISTMQPYSYDRYYYNLDHLDSYLKSPEYYLNNFNDENNIIYDSEKGYSIKSQHSFNAMSDFALLDSVLEQYKKH